MKRIILALSAYILAFTALPARDFDTDFENATLRLDYVFCGDATGQDIYLRQAFRTSAWAGRRKHLDEAPLKGNGQIRVCFLVGGQPFHRSAFSCRF